MFDSEEQGPVPARSFNGNGTSSRFGSGGIGWYSEDKDPHILLNNLAGPQSSTQAIMETKKVGNNTVTTTTTTTASTATTGTNACSVSTRCQFDQHHFTRAFLYKSASSSFSLMVVWLCNFFSKRISVQKLFVNC